MVVRGRFATVATMVSQASDLIGVVSRKGEIAWSESEESLHTQLGEEGQGDKVPPLIPRFNGRSPEKEKSDMV